MPATELLKAYDTDQAKADSLYRGKRITVRGMTISIAIEVEGYITITLGSSTDYAVDSVKCYFETGDPALEERLLDVQAGDFIAVTGTCQGLDGADVILTDCD